MRSRRFLWLALPVAALVALWAGRQPLTAVGVRQYLQSKGVPARFNIRELSAWRVVLQDLALGSDDESSARRLTIDYTLGLAPRVARITLEGARLKALVRADGSYDLGALQPLVPPPSDDPLTLPDFDLHLIDTRLHLMTPAGPVDLTVNGAGRPSQGYHATATGSAARLNTQGVRAEDVRLYADITLRDKRVLVVARGTAAGITAPGPVRSTHAALAFQGAVPLMGGPIAGAWALRSDTATLPGGQAVMPRAKGLARFSPETGSAWVRADADAARVRPDAATAREARRLWADVPASPLDPLKAALARSLDAVIDGQPAQARATLAWHGSSGVLALRSARLGALAAIESPDLQVALHTLQATGSAAFSLTPSGLPPVTGRLTGLAIAPGRPPAGALTLNPVRWRARDVDVALGRTAVSLTPGGAALATDLTASLAYPGGRIEGLRVPLALERSPDGTVRVPAGCRTLSIAQGRYQSLAMQAASARLCSGGGPLLALTPQGIVQSRATLAISALGITQDSTRLMLAPQRITLALSGSVQNPAIALDAADLSAAVTAEETRADLKADSLSLRWKKGVANIRLAGGAATLAGQPVAVSGVSFGASIDASGAVQVRDAAALVRNTDPRPAFAPMRLSKLRVDLRDNTLEGDGALLLSAKAQRIGRLRFRHDLNAAKGSARIEIDGLTFSPDLEAFELTELARGQVENVSGTIAAHADFAWAQTLTAQGAIAFQNVSLATAALGPIEGINGTITLDDLLGPHSPPGQTITIAKINPGVEVNDGALRFQLLPGFRLGVEDARWPFAGGALYLEPLVIDPAAQTQRLTFRADNMDAALLLEQFDLKNLRVTGRLDGTFPIVSQGSELRIENGRITTQPGGGLIQYVGDIGKEVSGPSKLAFDALQRFRYDTATLDLNGDLAGEIIAAIRFSGENQAPIAPVSGLPVKADGLPFKFTVTVRAPFRSLLNTASGLFDARKVLEQARPIDTDAIPGAAPNDGS